MQKYAVTIRPATESDLVAAMELRCDLPADAPSACLSADRPACWELEVKLNLPGLDFNETYLVPIYSP